MAKDLDLDLSSLWFTTLPPAFPPPSIQALGPTTHTYTYGWDISPTGTTKTLILGIRFLRDSSTTKLKLTWQANSPLSTVTVLQKHFPPPPPLSEADLDKAHSLYSANIVAWCTSAIGTAVGDGECWTLVNNCLTDLAHTYRQHGKEPPLLSQGRSHGSLILALSTDDPGSIAGLGILQIADVRPGDILQMTNAHFRSKKQDLVGTWGNGEWRKGGEEKNVRMGHHTAVVAGVEGDKLSVVEQNGSVGGIVAETTYDLGELVGGRVEVWRVIEEGSGAGLDANWD
jgi:hypothetical protein